jgi:phage/plasmid primase-like uncharacterized protein
MNARRDILGVARNLGARLRRSGGEWVGPCPVCGGKDRFAINPSKGLWNCRGCGRGGDAIDLVRRVTGGSFRSAVAVVDGEPRPDHSCDVCPTQRVAKQATAPAAPRRADRRGLALWRKAAPIDRTPADLYLGARGFAPPYPATLGYLPGRGGHPHALIPALGLPNEPEPGLLRIQDAAVRAVHLTRLDPIGTKRLKTDDAKIIVGQGELGFPVALTPVNDGLGLLIVEGIETRCRSA